MKKGVYIGLGLAAIVAGWFVWQWYRRYAAHKAMSERKMGAKTVLANAKVMTEAERMQAIRDAFKNINNTQ